MAWHRRSKVPNHQLQEWHLDAEKKIHLKITSGWNDSFEGGGRVGKKSPRKDGYWIGISSLRTYWVNFSDVTWHHLKVVVLQGRHQQKSSQNYFWYLIFEYFLFRTLKGADFTPSSILDQHSMVVKNGSGSTCDLEPSVVFHYSIHSSHITHIIY